MKRVLLVLAAIGLVGGCIKRNPDFVGQTGDTDGSEDGMGPTTSPMDTTNTSGPATDTGMVTTANTDTNTDGMDTEDDTGVPLCEPDLESIRTTIFNPKCAGDGCHESKTKAGNLDLTTADLWVDFVDVSSTTCRGWTRVVPEAPDMSMLYARVTGITTCTPVEFVEHEELNAEERGCLADWINSIEACERCGGMACVDLQTDALHCGECGNTCPAGIDCVAGVCDCPGTQTACGTECVDTSNDMAHCGGCDNDCSGALCVSSMCDCLPTELNCGSCIDPDTNSDHCGDCNQPCGLGETCQSGSCDCSDVAVSLSADVQPILTANCTASNCHDAVAPKMGMDLTDGATYANTVSVATMQCGGGATRVIPNDPTNSYVMRKLLGVDICAGVQMPNGGGVLPDSDLDTIAAWICQGAMDN